MEGESQKTITLPAESILINGKAYIHWIEIRFFDQWCWRKIDGIHNTASAWQKFDYAIPCVFKVK